MVHFSFSFILLETICSESCEKPRTNESQTVIENVGVKLSHIGGHHRTKDY